jgi:hypothetical protein
MRLIVCLIALACLSSVGCQAKVVYSVQPLAGTTPDCLDTIIVQFDSKFAPGTFTAKLDGTDIAPLFTPVPTPGGRSSAPVVAPFTRLPFGTQPRGIVLTYPSNDHVLTVGGQCLYDTFYCVTQDTVVFRANSFTLDHGVNVKVGADIIGLVQPAVTPTKTTPIVFQPSNNAIRIDEMPSGDPKTEVIYGSAGVIPYKITGVNAGPFTLTLTPPYGCGTTAYNGIVSTY